jgi:hypothetical protein
MANYWVRVEEGVVVECLGYNPNREGDWREAVDILANPIPNRQIVEGYYFDTSKTPVEIVWGVKDLSVNDRKETLLMILTQEERRAISFEITKEFQCSCSTNDNCCIDTITENILSLRQKREQISLLNSHEQIDEYMAANNL